MTRYIFVLLMLLFFVPAQAQTGDVENAYHISIDLQNVTADKDRIKITILTPPIQARTIKYVLPEYIPGVYGKVDAGRFIHQFYALDDKGYPLKVSKKGNNVILMKMRKGATLKKIEYWVDDTRDAEKSKSRESDEHYNYIPQASGTNFEAGTNYVLNHAFLFGYILGYADIAYHVTVYKPVDLSGISAMQITNETQTRDSYSALSYREIIDNPVMYSKADTVGFNAGNFYVTIAVFSENGRISARLVRRLIASGIMSSANFIPEIGERNYKMIFYFTTPFKTLLNTHGNYGGSPHRNSTFYFLPELADEDELSNELNRETSGDLLHLLAPLDYQSVLSNNNFSKPQLCNSWWFLEGANMYLSWLSAIRDSAVSETEFMGYVSSKIRLSQMLSGKPITDVKLTDEWMKVPLKREAIRAKAMLLAMLLDINITSRSGGKTGLREVIINMNKYPQFNSDSLEIWLIRESGCDLNLFFRNFVDGIKPLMIAEEFEKIGWAYAPSAIDSVLTFGRFGLIYNDNLDAFFVSNADTTNLFGLKNGDRIVSVNGNIVGSSNFDEALSVVYSPKQDDEVDLRFIRNDQNFMSKAVPYMSSVVVEYLIRPDAAADAKELELHNRIFSPYYR
ncbi:peptidase M61 [soil metagenome]